MIGIQVTSTRVCRSKDDLFVVERVFLGLVLIRHGVLATKRQFLRAR